MPDPPTHSGSLEPSLPPRESSIPGVPERIPGWSLIHRLHEERAMATVNTGERVICDFVSVVDDEGFKIGHRWVPWDRVVEVNR